MNTPAQDFINPTWQVPCRFSETWQDLVTESTRVIWQDLTLEQRVIVGRNFEKIADDMIAASYARSGGH